MSFRQNDPVSAGVGASERCPSPKSLVEVAAYSRVTLSILLPSGQRRICSGDLRLSFRTSVSKTKAEVMFNMPSKRWSAFQVPLCRISCCKTKFLLHIRGLRREIKNFLDIRVGFLYRQQLCVTSVRVEPSPECQRREVLWVSGHQGILSE
jgi:hypothetical protein